MPNAARSLPSYFLLPYVAAYAQVVSRPCRRNSNSCHEEAGPYVNTAPDRTAPLPVDQPPLPSKILPTCNVLIINLQQLSARQRVSSRQQWPTCSSLPRASYEPPPHATPSSPSELLHAALVAKRPFYMPFLLFKRRRKQMKWGLEVLKRIRKKKKVGHSGV